MSNVTAVAKMVLLCVCVCVSVCVLLLQHLLFQTALEDLAHLVGTLSVVSET